MDLLYSGHLWERTASNGDVRGCPHFRGGLIRGMLGCPYLNFRFGMNRVMLRVFTFQGYFKDVHISGASIFQGCPYFRGVHISRMSIF